MSIIKQKADAISAMKTISIALVLVFVLLSSGAAQIPQTDGEVWEEIRIHSGIPLQDIEELRTAPPAVAWKFFRGLAQGYGDRKIGKDLVRRAGRVIADNEAVGDLVREQLAKTPHDFHTSSERSHLLLPLGSIPAPWSARLLGQYLMDPTPMTPGDPELDYSASSNVVLALAALSRMGFSDAPTKDYIPLIRAGTMESWKDWWIKNESRIDERIREINPDYQPVSASPVPSPTTMPKSSPSASASPPATPPMAEPSRNSLSASATPQKSFLLSAAGAVGLLLIVGALVWFSRRR